MTDRPILFSPPMLREILAGRKTQTRRCIKWPLLGPSDGRKRRVYRRQDLRRPRDREAIMKLCPYGKPGDRLWVKSKWLITDLYRSPKYWPSIIPGDAWVFRGKAAEARDATHVRYAAELAPELEARFQGGYRSSLLMPRWASKVTLTIKSIRLERLQSISAADVKAEGFRSRKEMRALWDKLNAKRGFSWSDNPHVWVVEWAKYRSGGDRA